VRLAGVRAIELVPVKELQALTGYIRGGVTVLAARKAFPIFADWTIERHGVTSVSGGKRGLQILLAPGDYLRATHAVCGEIARLK
jgi:Cys-tRNA(Pro)/Cys-tRNA(Cys) deacylase